MPKVSVTVRSQVKIRLTSSWNFRLTYFSLLVSMSYYLAQSESFKLILARTPEPSPRQHLSLRRHYLAPETSPIGEMPRGLYRIWNGFQNPALNATLCHISHYVDVQKVSLTNISIIKKKKFPNTFFVNTLCFFLFLFPFLLRESVYQQILTKCEYRRRAWFVWRGPVLISFFF